MIAAAVLALSSARLFLPGTLQASLKEEIKRNRIIETLAPSKYERGYYMSMLVLSREARQTRLRRYRQFLHYFKAAARQVSAPRSDNACRALQSEYRLGFLGHRFGIKSKSYSFSPRSAAVKLKLIETHMQLILRAQKWGSVFRLQTCKIAIACALSMAHIAHKAKSPFSCVALPEISGGRRTISSAAMWRHFILARDLLIGMAAQQ